MGESRSDGLVQDAALLISEMEQRRGVHCAGCDQVVGFHEVLMCIAIGFKNQPLCLRCLAADLEQDPARLRDQLMDYIRHRECFAEAWNWASHQSGLGKGEIPPGLLELEGTGGGCAPVEPSGDGSKEERVAQVWDAGEMGCGDLVLELRMRMELMRPGEIMKLCARDPGAAEDLPAWCRLTGQILLRAEHPVYWIKRKE